MGSEPNKSVLLDCSSHCKAPVQELGDLRPADRSKADMPLRLPPILMEMHGVEAAGDIEAEGGGEGWSAGLRLEEDSRSRDELLWEDWLGKTTGRAMQQ